MWARRSKRKGGNLLSSGHWKARLQLLLQAAVATVLAVLDPACLQTLLIYASLGSWTGIFNRDAAVPEGSQHFSLLIFGSWWTMRALESHRDCWKGQIMVYSGKVGSCFPTVPSPAPCHAQAIVVLKTRGEDFKSLLTVSCQSWIPEKNFY